MSKKLTEGQQAVIQSYDNQIANQQRLLKEAQAAWVNGASYEDVRYISNEIERLSQWRSDELEAFNNISVLENQDFVNWWVC